ncbi:MAG TPA: bifunctional acetate--CoA ligase family protein/GNAT family N-acetyltransferase [Polaromonas sp.]|uniref:bifunctional acetate--CoA ligase family protein/GNAT family N-acetyltransferase n=1 Tax=Polaromonas sp. TaxID=1869339 RepID=UPI002D2B8846|nr:bifunctional acetate--CoA ligase family protein/GNAT family N-acetyltransferase [Polaromonas sp.]HYW58310.1 bifunctional acetate--CoA ligase family protein/GNAT family N-acetyltransferase [Polaromonas sp.]
MSVRNLEALFQPASVALIGASDREGSLGSVILRNLRAGGFQGPVWPVNRRLGSFGGTSAWRDVESLPQAPDLAVICTPAETVPELIAALGRKGTRAAIVLSAGLKQATGADGLSLEQAMLDAARPHLLRILGPNCIGALVPGIGLNASFAPGNALPGKLAFVTQSGALATAMLDWANSRSIGFSHFISLGDSADVDFGDVIDYLASDPATRAILMYMESVKSARKFMSAARAAARNKPVIVVKAGRAPEGARAAASHTGALAGSDVVFDAAVRRAGMLRVDTLEALFDAAETLTYVKGWHGERLAVLTNGGGAGVLAADALALGGGKLGVLEDRTLDALNQCLPPTWSHGNPIDIVGDAPVSRYEDALKVLLVAPEVDGVLFIHAPTAIVPADQIVAACLPLAQTSGKPVLTCWLGGAAVAAARLASAAAGVASYDTPERAAAAWLQLVTHARNQQALQQLPASELEDFTPDRKLAQSLLDDALREGREWLGDAQAQALLRAYGIPTVQTVRTGNVEEAVAAATRIGYPVALKIVSPQVIHKSDVGGVALNLVSEEDLRRAAEKMLRQVNAQLPQAQILGFTVQAMAERPGAHELIVGIASDPVFGPVMLLGEGGVAVELHKNHVVALPPLNTRLAQDMLAGSRLSLLLAGYRGRPPADEAALLSTLLKVSQMACDLAWLAELDINPLLVDERGVLALDARVRLRTVPAGEHSHLAIRPYPQALEEHVQIKGQDVLLRPIRPEDGQRLKAFYAGASPADMRLRFFMSRREVPHSELARYSQIDYDREMTFVAILPQAGGDLVMLGEARAVCDPDNRVAEFAIQVATHWQGKGLGRLLLDKLTSYLRARGTAEVVGQCLPENVGMAALARRAGFQVLDGPLPEATTMRLLLR